MSEVKKEKESASKVDALKTVSKTPKVADAVEKEKSKDMQVKQPLIVHGYTRVSRAFRNKNK